MPSGTFEGYYRVTEILEPYTGLSDVPPDVLKNAADRGDRVHNFCELHAKGMLFQEVDDDCKGYVESFIEWFNSTVEEVISVEERFFCDDLKVTGQVDLICRIIGDTRLSIVDFKTPVSISKTWALQLSCYYNLASKKHAIGRCFALQLPKKGGAAKVVESEDQDTHFEIYKGILNAHKYFYPL